MPKRTARRCRLRPARLVGAVRQRQQQGGSAMREMSAQASDAMRADGQQGAQGQQSTPQGTDKQGGERRPRQAA